MRITTASSYATTINNLQLRQQDLSDAQARLSSGKRVLKASDDPAAAARAERALAAEARSDASQRSVEASKVLVGQTESALGDANELLSQAREALVAAGNASYTDAERAIQANKIQGLRDQLLQVANRSDGAGSYLFGGQGSNQPPFVDTPGGVVFRGLSGQTLTDADTALPLSSDGQAAWLSSRTGNGVFVTRAASNNVTNQPVKGAWIDPGSVNDPSQLFPVADTGYRIRFTSATDYTVESFPLATPNVATTESTGTFSSGRAIDLHGTSVNIAGAPVAGDQFEITPSTPTLSVFAALDQAVATLKQPGLTGAQRAQGTSDTLRNVDANLVTLSTARSVAGEVLNRIDGVTDRLSAQKLDAKAQRSNAEDLDLVQALSDFQNKQNGYDAALKSYSAVQKLSLFQYVNP
jgi:flagellar hook-associated protein 3 FlgL